MAIHSILSICSGIGGLDLGVHLANPGAKTICYIEREAYSAATLVARMEDQTVAPVSGIGGESSNVNWRLNPVFVERLMGLPIGWSRPTHSEKTEYEHWETESCLLLRLMLLNP